MFKFLVILVFSFSLVAEEFKPIESGQKYHISYFNYDSNQDEKKEFTLIRIDQNKKIITVKDESGNEIELTRKQISAKQRPYIFHVDYLKKIKIIQSNKKFIEMNERKKEKLDNLNFEIGKEYKLLFIDSRGVFQNDNFKIVKKYNDRVSVSKDGYLGYFTFDNINIAYASRLMPNQARKIKEDLSNFYIGDLSCFDFKVKDNYVVKTERGSSHYGNVILFNAQLSNFNKDLSKINLKIKISSKKFGVYGSFSISEDFINSKIVPLSLIVKGADSNNEVEKLKSLKSSLKSNDLLIKYEGLIKNNKLENLKVYSNKFMSISFKE